MAFPNVRLSNRPLHFIYLCDCSGSMAAQGKMQALNQACLLYTSPSPRDRG